MLYHYNLDMFLIYTHILQVWHTLREHVGKLLGGRGGGGFVIRQDLSSKAFMYILELASHFSFQ